MPDGDGFELISAVRAASPARRSIVLSVRGGEADKIRALDLGADDFVTKPFSLGELLARVRAQLRRNAGAATPQLRFADLTIDLERRRVVQGEREIKLTPTEFALLELLALNAGKPVTFDQIIARVWGGRAGDDQRHRARPRQRAAAQDRARPGDAALPGHRAVGRLPLHRRAAVRAHVLSRITAPRARPRTRRRRRSA